MKLLERITVEPGKCGGRPCIRGLRIRVTDILGMLADGVSHEVILNDFSYLEPDDIKAALAYAARQADHAVLQAVLTSSSMRNFRRHWPGGSAVRDIRPFMPLIWASMRLMMPFSGDTRLNTMRSSSARTRTSLTAGFSATARRPSSGFAKETVPNRRCFLGSNQCGLKF